MKVKVGSQWVLDQGLAYDILIKQGYVALLTEMRHGRKWVMLVKG